MKTPTEDWSRVYLVSSLLLLVSVWFYFSTKNKYSHWSSRGIAGPRPLPLIGNLLSYFLHTRPAIDCLWAKKYGKVYGIYRGSEPHLVVADAEVLRQISIKDFEFFPNHSFIQWLNKYEKNALIFLKDLHWKRVRATISPTFSSGKLKRMYKQLSSCAQDLVELFDEQLNSTDGQVQLKNLFSLYTLDSIASCGYGLKLERTKGVDTLRGAASRNQLVRHLLQLFDPSLLRFFCALLLPKSFLQAIEFSLTPARVYEPAIRLVTDIMDQRRKSGAKCDDYLQLLMDARLDADDEETGRADDLDQSEQHHASLSSQSLASYKTAMVEAIGRNSAAWDGATKLTDIEIAMNATVFLVVGLETTASTLAHCTYALAFHPEVQEKLCREISEIAHFDESTFSFTYEQLTQLVYLDSVISETLRMLSPFIDIDRVCSQNYYLEKYNLHLAKDSKLQLAYHAIMNDPDYWPEPEKFDPTRFMPENRHKIVPGSYCPFGLGPRHCIGMRFSLTEAKLGLAKLLMKFEFQPAPGTKFPPAPSLNIFVHNIKDPRVQLIPRN